MRKEGGRAAEPPKLFNLMFREPSDLTPSLTPSRTCEVAVCEVHALDSFGKHDLVDSACGWEGEVREKNKGRNEEARAVSAKNYLINIIQGTFSSDCAVPVSASHPPRFKFFMPTGRCHCVRSPTR